ncbi:MAG: class I SAM-dependent methyltransferase [Chthoniobacteraceae bacterium]
MSSTIAETLGRQSYNRERLDPQPGQPDYLHLRDLRDALGPFATDVPLRILDFGCGGSPYRALFPQADYRRADFTAMEGLDYRVGPDSRVDAPSETFDLVLSTQVLEHVAEPAIYLAEAWRALKPGGRLLLTTHGVYPDHGCPYDFWRWTADGLRRALGGVGFSVETMQQLTCDARALHYLWDVYAQTGLGDGGLRFGEKLARLLYRRALRGWAHRYSDRCYGGLRVRSSQVARDGALYIALLVSARKS